MIALLGASAIFLTASQAVINGPRDAFKTCLKEASSKAATDKVTADGYAAYVRNACGSQVGAFKGAVVKFDMGNKMSRSASDQDADQMISDFVDSALDNYDQALRYDPDNPRTLNDRRQCWDMKGDGSYVQRTPDDPEKQVGTHQTLMDIARPRTAMRLTVPTPMVQA